jgi:anaphase-promoting complex subunit 1
LDWPNFHNGVAAGLRLSETQSKVRFFLIITGVPFVCHIFFFLQLARTWIVYNKPEKLDFSHAGFLLALGLQVFSISL